MGHHHLHPLKPLRVEECPSLGDLLDAMAETSFGGRQVGHAWSVLRWVAQQPRLPVILTISGAMTVAKMGALFGSLISRGIVKAVVTTGALVTHSLVEELGYPHYKAHPPVSDESLHADRLNRIYDTLEPEENLEALENRTRKVLSRLNQVEAYGSADLIHHLSAELLLKHPTKGLLGAAVRHDVPVFVPAFGDSELGMYMFRFRHLRGTDRPVGPTYDGLKDLEQYASWLVRQRELAILTVGGGAPRNWAQQMLPFLGSEDSWKVLSENGLPKIVAGVRICPDPESLGHLSGSTYSEGVTWGKFPATRQNMFAEVHADATIVLPFLAKALFDVLDRDAEEIGINVHGNGEKG